VASLREVLAHEPNELKFGTSGLRALVTDMTDLECYINALGFIHFLQANDGLQAGGTMYLAGDLRDSTPRIMRAVLQAIVDGGCMVVNCGLVPTPTVSYYGFEHDAPSIMVTGSHIPADRNGIKFVKRAGEVLKEDEQPIKDAVAKVRAELYAQDEADSKFDHDGMLKAPPMMPKATEDAVRVYETRYETVFGSDALKGLQVVFYQHSCVGRDQLVKILERLGANVIPEGRSDVFIPIDSENVTPENQQYFKELAAAHPGTFAIVSTDGDSDRPFMVDETGTFHRGDVLGAVVATWLHADFAAYPISTSDAADTYLDQHGVRYAHTKIGSPYVISAMESAGGRSVSWEVNGGFLTGNDITINGQTLKALPTRDAILPIIVAMIAAKEQGKKVSELFAQLPARFTQAGLIDNFPPNASVALVERYASDTAELRKELERFFTPEKGFSEITEINTLDGIRMIFSNGDIAHMRTSNNAPQLRMYSCADSQERADEIVALAIAEPNGIFRQLETFLTK